VDEARKNDAVAGRNVWAGTTEAIEHFRDVGLLWQALLLGTIPALLVLGPIQAVLPKMMTLSFPGDERFRAAFFGLMGAGLFLGSTLSLAHVGRSAHRKLLVGLFGIVAGATLVAMPFVPSKAVFSGLALVCGIGLGVPSAVVPVLLQEGTNSQFRSRVMNTNTLRVTVVPAVGAVLCGALSDAAGVKLSIALSGAVSVAATAAALVAIGRFERKSESRASSLP
jgi:predicted MFS family arabinose efflux permease